MSIEYERYLKRHRLCVKKGYVWMYVHLFDFLEENGINFEVVESLIKNHDNSKYGLEEYEAYDRYFYPEINGVESGEDTQQAFDYAWLHHIHHNPHHWQHWVLQEDEDGTTALEMPKEYAVEMVCDWWAFSWAESNLYEIFNWYDEHKTFMNLHPNTKKFAETLLEKIKGELELEKWREIS